MGWIGCIRCEKSRRDFVARTFALIAPVQPILHQVSCSNETIPNAPKHYKVHQNKSSRSSGVDRVCSLRKILTRLRGTNFCINCISSVCFAPSFMQLRTIPNELKYYEMYKNMSVGFKVVDRVRSLRKIPTRLRGTNICTSSAHFASIFEYTKIVRTAPKHQFKV